MLRDARLPERCWPYATKHAAYLHNRTLKKFLRWKTPFEIFWGSVPDVGNLRVFGSPVYYGNPDEKKKKWDDRARQGFFVGFSDDAKAYEILDPIRNHVYTTRDVTFYENTTPSPVAADLPLDDDSNYAILDDSPPSPTLDDPADSIPVALPKPTSVEGKGQPIKLNASELGRSLKALHLPDHQLATSSHTGRS
jgi:hypothetical protein